MDIENDIMPYKKKAKHVTPKKSKHEHKYVPCVLEYNSLQLTKEHGFEKTKPDARVGYYCPICGKIGYPPASEEKRWYTSSYYLHGIVSNLTEECKKELNPETRTLPTFWVEDGFFQKYVDLKHVSEKEQ